MWCNSDGIITLRLQVPLPRGYWLSWLMGLTTFKTNSYRFKATSMELVKKPEFVHWYAIPVGVSKHSIPIFCPTLSIAALVGILRATPFNPVLTKYGMHMALSAMTATESDGVTKNPCCPRIMLRSYRKFKHRHVSDNQLHLKLNQNWLVPLFNKILKKA